MVRVLLQVSSHLDERLNLQDAWSIYQNFRRLPEVSFVGESHDGAEFDAALGSFITAHQHLPIRFWTDLQLASLAQMQELRLVSFDADFKRFKLEKMLVIEADR